MGKRKRPFLENVTIEDIGAEGKAIAKVDGKVLFIPYGIPGDIVDIQVTSTRKKFYEGTIKNYHKHSEDKTDPFCKHFGLCGGCKWQHLPYTKQLEFKQRQVIDNFDRIGKLTDYQVNTIEPSSETTYYRNKLEYTFSDNRWLTSDELQSDVKFTHRNALGFHIPKKFDKILNIEECFLQPEPSNKLRLEVLSYAIENNYSFFNIIKQEGFLRNLIIRTSTTNETMVIFSFFYEDVEKRTNLLEHIKNKFPEITSLLYVINAKKNETLFDQDIKTYHGKNHIIENLDGLKFKIGPKSFYQTNSKQAEKLYKVTKEMAGIEPENVIFDLYTGTGTIANYLAGSCKKIIGIEIIPEAIEDAKINATFNNIENAEFYAGDVKDVLDIEFHKKYGTPDIIVLDPPRAGLHPSVIDIVLKLSPKTIVYVSCNPATQARDISMMTEVYKLEKIHPVDMFPHTHHVENVAKLTLK